MPVVTAIGVVPSDGTIRYYNRLTGDFVVSKSLPSGTDDPNPAYSVPVNQNGVFVWDSGEDDSSSYPAKSINANRSVLASISVGTPSAYTPYGACGGQLLFCLSRVYFFGTYPTGYYKLRIMIVQQDGTVVSSWEATPDSGISSQPDNSHLDVSLNAQVVMSYDGSKVLYQMMTRSSGTTRYYHLENAGGGGYTSFSGQSGHYLGGGFGLADGTWLLSWYSTTSPFPYKVCHHSADMSSVIAEYSVPKTYSTGVLCYPIRSFEDSSKFWWIDRGGNSLSRRAISDGVADRTFAIPFDGIANMFETTVTVSDTVPIDTPEAPQIDCDPQTEVGAGGRGAAGCNTGGVGFVTTNDYTAGGIPEHDDPEVGELVSGKVGLEVWIELVHEGTTYRRAMVPLSDRLEGGYKSPGLVSVGVIEHALGNERGGYEPATIDVELSDTFDNLIRGIIGDDEEIEGDELRVKIASDELRGLL